MDGLDPFLSNFNPLLSWLDYQAPVVTDFLANPSSSTADFLLFHPSQSEPLHLSRQMTIFTAESLAIHQQRLKTNRGNGYLQPFAIGSYFPTTQAEIFPSHDCDNTFGGQQVMQNPPSSPLQEESGQFPLRRSSTPTTRGRSVRTSRLPGQSAGTVGLRLHRRTGLPGGLRRRQDPDRLA